MRIWFNRGFSLAPIAGLMRAADPALDVFVSVSPKSARYPGPTATWVDGGAEGEAGHDPEAYLAWVRATIAAHAIDLFVPTRHRAMLAAADLPCRVHLPASPAVLQLLDDKYTFAEVVADEDYHLPTHLVRGAADLEALIAQWPDDGAGICVKPRNGVNGLGFWRLDDVSPMLHLQQPDWRKIQTAQYLAALREQEARGPIDEIVAMAFLPGPEISFDILADHGRLLKYAARTKLANGHQHIASAHPLEPALTAIVRRFELHGLVNAQFRRAIDGSWKLLEINARPAGGVIYADQVGCRLVADWAGLLTGRLTADTIDRSAIDTEVAFATVVQDLAA
ncbi:ATP-grasp domain-containing protein [Sphingomonas sp.]|uniref:ATP-grasp domain-containing protein n=1 Tax=Sphingomonas sp. TaxID=28214 RepID=UPI0031D124AA